MQYRCGKKNDISKFEKWKKISNIKKKIAPFYLSLILNLQFAAVNYKHLLGLL